MTLYRLAGVDYSEPSPQHEFTPEEIRLIRIAVRKLINSEQYHSHDDHEHERSAVGRIETLKTVLEKLK